MDAEQLCDLLSRCVLRDQQAFRARYQHCSGKLFAVAVRIPRRREWAEEVLQQSFINIWNHASGYNAAKSAPMTWMTAIVRNRALDLLRRPREVEIDEGHEDLMASIPDESPGPEELLKQSMEAGALGEGMKQLAGGQQKN